MGWITDTVGCDTVSLKSIPMLLVIYIISKVIPPYTFIPMYGKFFTNLDLPKSFMTIQSTPLPME
jgi:hypothetical protein